MIVKLEKAPEIRLLLEMLTDDWTPVIETDLTKEEKEIVRKGRKQYKEHPEDFISLEDLEAKIYGKKSA